MNGVCASFGIFCILSVMYFVQRKYTHRTDTPPYINDTIHDNNETEMEYVKTGS